MANAEDTDKKAERLRRARDLMASRGGAAPTAAPVAATAPTSAAPPEAARGDQPGTKGHGLLDMLAGLFRPKPAQSQTAAPAQTAGGVETPAFTVVVAALAGDADGSAATYLNQALTARPTLKVKALGKAFQLDNLEDPSLVSSLVLNTRHAVAEEDADLLVWGDFGKEGYRLRLATAAADDDRAAAFGPSTRVELPKGFNEPANNLLYAAILAAMDPTTETQRSALRRHLPAAATAAEVLAGKPPVQMSMPQQRSVQLVFGHVATASALSLPAAEAGPWLDKAINAYRQAQRRLGRTDPGWETGLLHKHIAAALAIKAEREKGGAAPLWEEAITEWRQAVETLPRALMPQEWASVQVKLGVGLYRLDLLTGQTELLRESLQALQATLQVYSRTETPQRWAEIMHTVAQVLEVYGDQAKSVDVLKRAVDACHSVLEIRTRERSPLAWAATQNTLGSALFMIDRHSEGSTHLAEAEEVLSGALEVFQAYGAKGPAKVAAKNLAHVRKLAEARKGRKGIDPHWLDE
jgi:hypothetical protein